MGIIQSEIMIGQVVFVINRKRELNKLISRPFIDILLTNGLLFLFLTSFLPVFLLVN